LTCQLDVGRYVGIYIWRQPRLPCAACLELSNGLKLKQQNATRVTILVRHNGSSGAPCGRRSVPALSCDLSYLLLTARTTTPQALPPCYESHCSAVWIFCPRNGKMGVILRIRKAVRGARLGPASFVVPQDSCFTPHSCRTPDQRWELNIGWILGLA
jgi:hypothetical protein